MPAGVRPLPAVLGLVALLASAAVPGAAATQHEAAQELNARALNLLFYHPYPDPQGDEWGFAEPNVTGSDRDYMQTLYGFNSYPLAVFDGVDRFDGAVDHASTLGVYEGAFLRRLAADSPVRMFLLGSIDAATNETVLTIKAQAKKPLASASLGLRVALFEDEVPFAGGNGVTSHRFTVRATAPERAVGLDPDEEVAVEVRLPLDPAWSAERLGFVASIHNRDAQSPEFQPDEVLQSATYKFGQQGPTIQLRRGVLLEMLTATWCPACLYGDGAGDELANRYGVASTAFLRQGSRYLRELDVGAISFAGVAGLATGGLAWLHQRDRRRHA